MNQLIMKFLLLPWGQITRVNSFLDTPLFVCELAVTETKFQNIGYSNQMISNGVS
jgi:hypothetical protein